MESKTIQKSFVDLLQFPVPDFTATHLTALESLSLPYELTLKGYTSRRDLSAKNYLHRSLALQLQQNGAPKIFHGVIDSVTSLHFDVLNKKQHYQLIIKPAMAFWAYRKNSRIFQQQSVIDIITLIADENASVDVAMYDGKHCSTATSWSATNIRKEALVEHYPALAYCVQYNESDLDFVHRLLSQYGIGYYFSFDQKNHYLHLFDDSRQFLKSADNLLLSSQSAKQSQAYSAETTESLAVSTVIARDYSAALSHLSLRSQVTAGQTIANLQTMLYPSHTSTLQETQKIAQRVIQREQCQAKRIIAQLNRCHLLLGQHYAFYDEVDSIDSNSFYLTTLETKVDDIEKLNTDTHQRVDVSITALDSNRRYCPVAIHAVPKITGHQTATVVGVGDSIDVNDKAQVKVKFHWEQSTVNDTLCSAYIDVAQPAAGEYGWQMIPRIGQEVMVFFEEADPNRPIICGSLHNDLHRPNDPLPENHTKTYFRTHTQESSNTNDGHELCFEDALGSESVYLKSQKDLNITVANRFQNSVTQKRHVTVVGQQTTAVCHGALTINAATEIVMRVGGSQLKLSGAGFVLNSATIQLQTVGNQPGKGIARQGDSHHCPTITDQQPHNGGPVLKGSNLVWINSQPAARKDDPLHCDASQDKINQNIAGLIIDGQPAGYETAKTEHGGTVTQGSPNVFSAAPTTAIDWLAFSER